MNQRTAHAVRLLRRSWGPALTQAPACRLDSSPIRAFRPAAFTARFSFGMSHVLEHGIADIEDHVEQLAEDDQEAAHQESRERTREEDDE